jgi:hypothetical protein
VGKHTVLTQRKQDHQTAFGMSRYPKGIEQLASPLDAMMEKFNLMSDKELRACRTATQSSKKANLYDSQRLTKK